MTLVTEVYSTSFALNWVWYELTCTSKYLPNNRYSQWYMHLLTCQHPLSTIIQTYFRTNIFHQYFNWKCSNEATFFRLYRAPSTGTLTAAPGNSCVSLHNYLRSKIYYSNHKIANRLSHYFYFGVFKMCVCLLIYNRRIFSSSMYFILYICFFPARHFSGDERQIFQSSIRWYLKHFQLRQCDFSNEH